MICRLVLILALLAMGCARRQPANLLGTIRGTVDGEIVEQKSRSPFQEALAQRLAVRPAADEIFLLETLHPGGGWDSCIEVVRVGDRAELRFIEARLQRPRTDRYLRRELTAEELAGLQKVAKRLDPQPLYDHGTFDGVEYHWTHADASGARSVVMNNPHEDDVLYYPAVQRVKQLLRDRPLEAVYADPLAEGAKLLYADPVNAAARVWARGDDIRALIGPAWSTLKEWHAFRNCRWEPCKPPADPLFEAGADDFPWRESGVDYGGSFRPPEQTRWRDGYVFAGRENRHYKDGTFWVRRNQPAERLLEDKMEYFTVPPGGDRIIGTYLERLFCFDLNQRKEIPLPDGEALRNFQVFEYFPELKGVLIVKRPKSPYGETWGAEWRLLDPSTLKSRPVEFDHWAQVGYPRPQRLQPTAAPGVFWMARRDEDYRRTTVWRFDRKRLDVNFQNAFHFDNLLFDSRELWIDEPALRAYVINDGHLFQIPISPSAPKDDHEESKP